MPKKGAITVIIGAWFERDVNIVRTREHSHAAVCQAKSFERQLQMRYDELKSIGKVD